MSQQHTGFSVWFRDPIPPDDQDALRFKMRARML